MRIDVQMKINSDPKLISFIRENPIWYKNLNRNPNLFKEFTMDMKDKYKLRPSDRINKALSNIGMIESIINILK